VRPRQRPAAGRAVVREPVREDGLDVERDLPVAQLPHVEVPRSAVDPGANPAEKDVARSLHEPLPVDDALPVIRETACANQRLEDRRLGFLHLEEQRVALVAAEHEQRPAPCADATDADDLSSDVAIAEPLEQHAAIGCERVSIASICGADRRLGTLVMELGERHDQRRLGNEARVVGQGRERTPAVVRLRLDDRPLQRLCELRVARVPQPANDRLRIETRVPHVEVAHLGEPRHRLAIRLDGPDDGCRTLGVGEPSLARGYLDARRETLHVPLERTGERLVEVVQIEHEVPLR
jgi:hypothetical protein